MSAAFPVVDCFRMGIGRQGGTEDHGTFSQLGLPASTTAAVLASWVAFSVGPRAWRASAGCIQETVPDRIGRLN